MRGYTRETLDEEFNIIKQFRQDADGKIELIAHKREKIRFIKRTYYEDKREVFELLSKADTAHLAQIEAVLFDTDTIVLEEYIEGENLSKYLCHSAISSKQAEKFVMELLYAVSAIHKMGIIHRDIKPENILIDKSGHLYLIDFGIARIYRHGKETDTQLLGTVGYAAPEQFGYAQSDFRSDIYSIGVTCRDLNHACKKNHLLQKIERKCMKIDPGERYPDTSAILKEFRKKRIISGSVIALAALLLISIGIGAYSLRQQKEAVEKKGDLLSGAKENRLFGGQDDALYLMLTEGTKKSTEISLAEKENAVMVLAQLTPEGLSISLTDSSDNKSEFTLSNQYGTIDDYPDTSLYAEVLFLDLNGDGRDEIWAAISDRSLVTLLNGQTAVNQNYMAGWCIYQDENGRFRLADGQLFTHGQFELGTIIPNGVWMESEFEGYILENGSFVNVY